eukprot:COSAG02_NODE_73859_length_165_cov_29090.696970_1_plen_42_part_01
MGGLACCWALAYGTGSMGKLCLRTVLTFPRIGVVNKQAMEQH